MRYILEVSGKISSNDEIEVGMTYEIESYNSNFEVLDINRDSNDGYYYIHEENDYNGIIYNYKYERPFNETGNDYYKVFNESNITYSLNHKNVLLRDN